MKKRMGRTVPTLLPQLLWASGGDGYKKGSWVCLQQDGGPVRTKGRKVGRDAEPSSGNSGWRTKDRLNDDPWTEKASKEEPFFIGRGSLSMSER